MFVRAGALVPFLVSAVAVAAATPPARADEAYLCGPDNVVYVKASELEAKKHSDPCIAAFYGVTLPGTATTQKIAVTAAAEPSAARAVAEPIAFKRLTETEIPERITAKKSHARSASPAAAAPDTDYRNVRIINASTDTGQWFWHAH
jgi:hypothetical protein